MGVSVLLFVLLAGCGDDSSQPPGSLRFGQIGEVRIFLEVPLNYGGKPSNAFPSFMVITIVLTIFSITILSLFTFSWRAKLWPSFDKPIYHPEATDDKFVILVNRDSTDANKAASVMKETGAIEVIEKS